MSEWFTTYLLQWLATLLTFKRLFSGKNPLSNIRSFELSQRFIALLAFIRFFSRVSSLLIPKIDWFRKFTFALLTPRQPFSFIDCKIRRLCEWFTTCLIQWLATLLTFERLFSGKNPLPNIKSLEMSQRFIAFFAVYCFVNNNVRNITTFKNPANLLKFAMFFMSLHFDWCAFTKILDSKWTNNETECLFHKGTVYFIFLSMKTHEDYREGV